MIDGHYVTIAYFVLLHKNIFNCIIEEISLASLWMIWGKQKQHFSVRSEICEWVREIVMSWFEKPIHRGASLIQKEIVF